VPASCTAHHGASNVRIRRRDYNLYSKYGLPLYGALTLAQKRREKAIARLQPLTVEAR
jgi:hypothetical protein